MLERAFVALILMVGLVLVGMAGGLLLVKAIDGLVRTKAGQKFDRWCRQWTWQTSSGRVLASVGWWMACVPIFFGFRAFPDWPGVIALAVYGVAWLTIAGFALDRAYGFAPAKI